MTLQGKRYVWRIEPADGDAAERMAEAAGCSVVMAGVLAARGVTSPGQARAYLEPMEATLPEPGLLPDAERVVARVSEALRSGELIAVHGHDDPDGVTATTIMLEALRQLGASVTTYIPDRRTEGHGLNRRELDGMHAAGVGLIVTVDSCVSDREFIAYGNSLGIDTIVTDHHEIPPELPPAVAVVDPKLPDSRFPYRYMAGVGVSLRVADLLLGELGGDRSRTGSTAPWCGHGWRDEALALAAIGSITDRVPLTGDNRVIVTQGLAAVPMTERVGLRAALEVAGLWGRVPSTDDVRETLGPMLGRSPGDVRGTQRALELLLSTDPDAARELAEALSARQTKWRETATSSWRKVKARLDSEVDTESVPVIVLVTDVPVAVMGYVTSRTADDTGRPAVLLTSRDSGYMAEARGPSGFNFVDAFATMAELFTGYGGHPRAAGFSIPADNVESFRQRFLEYAESNPPSPDPKLLDAELGLQDVSLELAEELERMSPFGQGNPRASLLARGVTAEELADAESLGVRFGTPVTAPARPTDMVYRLRDSDGVPLVSFVDMLHHRD